MKAVYEKGHQYELLMLDGNWDTPARLLTFVKRCSPPEKYPGNENAFPGTTLQSVMRCLVERLYYLQGQFWCLENWVIIKFLKYSLWLLEFRAARRHGHGYCHLPNFATYAPMCPLCGHTQCEH